MFDCYSVLWSPLHILYTKFSFSFFNSERIILVLHRAAKQLAVGTTVSTHLRLEHIDIVLTREITI